MKQMLCRDNRIFKRGILPALVLAALFSGIFAMVALSSYRDAQAGGEPVCVALVDEEDSVLSRLCISMVEGQSFFQRMLTVTAAEGETQARAMLASGECAAAILLPEGYVDALMVGEPCEGRILLSEAAASSGELVRELARCGELLLAAGQEAVFSGERSIAAHGLDRETHNAYLNAVNPELIHFVLEVYTDAFTADSAVWGNAGVPAEAHYAACWLALLLTVGGLFFPKLYTEDCRPSLLRRLYAAGVTPWQFLSGKLLFPGLLRIVLLALLLPLLHRIVPLSLSPLSVVCLLAATAAAGVTVSCAAVMLAGRAGWQALILAVSALGLFLAGGIVPSGMLPAALGFAGDLTPLGAVRGCLLPLFGGRVPVPAAAAAAVYTAGALLLCLRRLRRMPEKGGGE